MGTEDRLVVVFFALLASCFLSVRRLPEILDCRVVPGDPEFVGGGRVEGLRHDVEKGAWVRQRPVAVRDAGRNSDEDVVSASRDQDLGLLEGRGALPNVEENHLCLGGGWKEPDVVLLEVVVKPLD